VHGSVRSTGTVTGRMAHTAPNTGNIPSKGIYGEVCRQMYKVAEGRKLVGCDAAGVQLRALAHYLKDPILINQILEGDIHVYLAQNIYGLIPQDAEEPTHHKGRKTGKTCTYAILMGAGAKKIGSICGGDAKLGTKIFKQMEERLHGWKEFKQHIDKCARIKGCMTSLNGSSRLLKSSHYGMSVFLQSFEADVMKWAMCTAAERIKEAGLDGFQVAVVHDEFQYDCAEEDADSIGKILRQSIIDAGVHYNSNCPLDGEYKIGNNWLETH